MISVIFFIFLLLGFNFGLNKPLLTAPQRRLLDDADNIFSIAFAGFQNDSFHFHFII